MQSSDPDFDGALDAQLRAVPVPDGLLARLRKAAIADDEGLDAAIRDVPVPWDFLQRLRQITLAANAESEAAVGDRATAHGVTAKAPPVLKTGGRTRPWASWATAASLWIAIGLSLCGTLLVALVIFWPGRKTSAPDVAPREGQWAASAGNQQAEPGAVVVSPTEVESKETSPAAAPVPAPKIGLAEEEQPRPAPRPEVRNPSGRSLAGRSAPVRPGTSKQPWPSGLVGSRDADALPELKKVVVASPQGIKPPLVPGFPLDLYRRTRVNPFVSPAANVKLQTSVVPLSVGTASYELARRSVEEGELPPADKMRTEEFLAAVDYGFPNPDPLPLGLYAAGGPSPFGGEGLTLLQVGVQGRQYRHEAHRPVHLVLAVDASAHVAESGRLEMVRKALRRLVSCLGPDDRVSLIAFGENARLVVDNAGLAEAGRLAAGVASLSAEGATNVVAGLREAYAVAERRAAPRKIVTRVVLLTEDTPDLDGRGAAMVEQRLGDAAAQGIRLEVLEVGESPELDRPLAAFARAGGGRARHAAGVDQICSALLEGLTGKPTLLATGVRLVVSFDPRTVQEYRLLGHEATSSLLPGHPQADFHVGQSATALYEVRMKPGAQYHVATIELSWQPLDGRPRQTISRRVGLKQFASSFASASPSLQEAAVVARTAEVLRNVPGAPRGSRPLAQVLKVSEQMDRRLRERPSLAEFLSLVEHADKAKPHHAGVHK